MIKVSRYILIPIFFLIISLCVNNANAGLFLFESESLFSVRDAIEGEDELPFWQFIGATYAPEGRPLEINANLGFSNNQARSNENFHFYMGDVSYEIIPDLLKIKAGRSWDFFRMPETMTTDTVGGVLSLFEKQLLIGGYWGVERELEVDNFDTISDTAGAYATFRTRERNPYIFNLKYQNKQYNSPVQPQDDILYASLFKELPWEWSPELMLDAETNVNYSHLRRAEAGVDLYPTYKTALRFRGLTYDVRTPELGVNEPLFPIFSMGRLYEVLGQVEYMFTSKFLSSVGLYWDNYLLQGTTRTNGYRVDFNLKLYNDFSNAINKLYYLQSYGGDVIGDRIELSQKLLDNVDLKEVVDLTYYEKVTNSTRYALDTEAGFVYWFMKNLNLYVGGELDSNNFNALDARFYTKLTYTLWKDL